VALLVEITTKKNCFLIESEETGCMNVQNDEKPERIVDLLHKVLVLQHNLHTNIIRSVRSGNYEVEFRLSH
jgi:hypothetical protein